MGQMITRAAATACVLLATSTGLAQPWPPPQPTGTTPPPAATPTAEPAPATAEQPPAAPPADDSMLGGPGESCRARADCKNGFKCLNAVCSDPKQGESCMATSDCGGTLRCVQNICGGPQAGATGGPTGPSAPTGPSGPTGPEYVQEPGRSGSAWSDFDPFDGVHPFVGIAILPGMSLVHSFQSGAASDIGGAFLLGLRGGVLFGTTELAVELSPMTWVPSTDFGEPVFQTNFTIGSHLTLTDELHWPLRFGVGVAAADLPVGADVAFLTRFDLLGLNYAIGHLIIDAYFPSFRFGTEFENGGMYNWLFGVGATYAF